MDGLDGRMVEHTCKLSFLAQLSQYPKMLSAGKGIYLQCCGCASSYWRSFLTAETL